MHNGRVARQRDSVSYRERLFLFKETREKPRRMRLDMNEASSWQKKTESLNKPVLRVRLSTSYAHTHTQRYINRRASEAGRRVNQRQTSWPQLWRHIFQKEKEKERVDNLE